METVVPTATERLNDILLELPKYKSQWQLNVANPYVRAYDLALENFNRETKAQAERDRTMAELFVFAASIVSGSVMMAAFATTSVRVLAGRAMLSVICNNNLNRTFAVLSVAASNKTFMFALGGVLDEAKKLAGKQVTRAAEGLTSSAKIAGSSTAINYMTQIEDFINVNHICVHDFLQGVRDDTSISEENKSKIADLARRTPFCNPPKGRSVDEQRLAQKIELLFYMTAVLDSDKLVAYFRAPMGPAAGQEIEYHKRDIPQMPTDRNYPKEVSPRPGRPFDEGQRIKYDSVGSGIRERIDLLSMRTGNGRFYPEQNLATRIFLDPTDHAQIVKAEQIINRLANDARPRQLTDVRMI